MQWIIEIEKHVITHNNTSIAMEKPYSYISLSSSFIVPF